MNGSAIAEVLNLMALFVLGQLLTNRTTEIIIMAKKEETAEVQKPETEIENTQKEITKDKQEVEMDVSSETEELNRTPAVEEVPAEEPKTKKPSKI